MRVTGICIATLVLFPLSVYASETNNVFLGGAASFAVLGYSTVTNTGSSEIFGNLGLYPNTLSSITGFPPGLVSDGSTYAADAVAMQAQADALTAYNFAASETPTATLTGEDLGGMTLTPGVYFFSSSATLTGTLTLNDEGNPDAIFIFQIGSTLTTIADSSVVFKDSSGQGGSVTWQVGSSATIGAGTAFEGTIIADTSISLVTGASIGCGRAFALGGAVTMDTNTVSIADTGSCQATETAPEPGTASLLGMGMLAIMIIGFRKKRAVR
jgi:Ice-binding-like